MSDTFYGPGTALFQTGGEDTVCAGKAQELTRPTQNRLAVAKEIEKERGHEGEEEFEKT